jgi:tRNA A-37 threonylcarbamoyl transferase component Bud32
MDRYRKISKGDLKGWLHEELFHALPPDFLDDPVSSMNGMGAEILKESRLRWAAIATLPDGQKLFLKTDKTKGWAEFLKYLVFPSKGRKEWFVAYRLRKAALPIPKPLGWMERIKQGLVRESYYLSQAVGSGGSLFDDALSLGDRFPLSELARTAKKIHASGLFHKDLHAGNFLWDGGSLFLVDLHSARRVRRLSLNQRLWNLSHLLHSLRSVWGEGDRLRFLEAYLDGEAELLREKKKLLQKIDLFMSRLQKRQWKSRTKRCLKESTEFSIQKAKGIRTYRRRDYPLDRLQRVVEEHRQMVKERPLGLAKNAPEVRVSLVKEGEIKVCIKQFRNLHFWDMIRDHFRLSKGVKAWVGGNGLRVRGIPSLIPFALMEKRVWLGLRESFFLMEVSGEDQELDRYLLSRLSDFRKKRLFIKAFARWLAYLHQTDVYHRDMKTCNILVSENRGAWEFRLLDLEDIQLDEKVDERRLFRNLLQLNTSIPKAISGPNRLRFLKTYTSLRPIINDEKGFIRRLVHKSRERGIVYVSPSGVVEENWI